MSVEVRPDSSLKPYNTFGIETTAAFLVEYDTEEDLLDMCESGGMTLPWLHVGAGSNLLFTRPFLGMVFHSRIRDIEVVRETADDVLSRDYHIRPGIALLDQGSNTPYESFMEDYRYPGFVTDKESKEQFAAAKAAETDLGGTARFVDQSIDVGAYEYAAPMRQIIYVDDRLTTAGDGSSWENALTDLQDAVNLAGIYANTRPDEYGYVFAQSTVGQDGRVASLNVQLGGTKVYGGMHTERYNDGETEATDIVAGLLAQRRGMMESQGDHSQVTQLVIKPAQGEGRNTATSVVDGFQVTGGATVGQGGMLSTSIVENHGGTYAVTKKKSSISNVITLPSWSCSSIPMP